jgi:hypothetical protein
MDFFVFAYSTCRGVQIDAWHFIRSPKLCNGLVQNAVVLDQRSPERFNS